MKLNVIKMDCGELIELYHKVGGILTCNYKKKEMSCRRKRL
jgi:hypothetical protein